MLLYIYISRLIPPRHFISLKNSNFQLNLLYIPCFHDLHSISFSNQYALPYFAQTIKKAVEE